MTNLTAWKMAGAVLTLWAATTIAAQAQTFNNLFNFDGTTNGDDPYLMSLVQLLVPPLAHRACKERGTC